MGITSATERKILIPSVIIGVILTGMITFSVMADPAKADANMVAGLSVALAGIVGVMILAIYEIKLNFKIKLPGGTEIGLEHPEAKSDGDIGVLERKHLEIDKDSIKYIGKEANNLEFSQVREVLAEDSNEYVESSKED